MTENTTPPQAGSPAQSEPIPLFSPIVRGDTTIDTITLRKPFAQELRGLALQDLVRGDVGSLQLLIPRISSPILTAHEAATMDPADLMSCQGAVLDFLAPSLVQGIRSLTS
jgi:Phage tail assembly chaperone proteins, E, or 41 or 14